MSTHKEQMQLLIKQRSEYDTAKLLQKLNEAYLLAISDREAALELVIFPNRILKNILNNTRYLPGVVEICSKWSDVKEKLIATLQWFQQDGSNFGSILTQLQSIDRADAIAILQKDLGRTHYMQEAHPDIAQNPLIPEQLDITLGEVRYPCVTRDTRDFTINIISAGASMAREHILLDTESIH